MNDNKLRDYRAAAAMFKLRDYFAAAALPMAIKEMNDAESYDLNDAASLAYSYADAMLRQREKTND